MECFWFERIRNCVVRTRLPGDRIQMKQGLLFINGDPVKRERMDDLSSLARELKLQLGGV
jgi:hypothetical protein